MSTAVRITERDDESPVPLESFSNEHALEVKWRYQTRCALSGAALTVTYMVLYHARLLHRTGMRPDFESGIALVFLCLWIIGPPSWFAYESLHLITRSDKQNKSKRMAEFKLGQDAAKAFWIAITTLVIILYKRAE